MQKFYFELKKTVACNRSLIGIWKQFDLAMSPTRYSLHYKFPKGYYFISMKNFSQQAHQCLSKRPLESFERCRVKLLTFKLELFCPT